MLLSEIIKNYFILKISIEQFGFKKSAVNCNVMFLHYITVI